MSHRTTVKHNKLIDEYDCSGNGPRPPVPGKESRTQKMTETTNSMAPPTMAPLPNASLPTNIPVDSMAELNRAAKWQEKLSNLLSDEKGVELLNRFVTSEAGPHSIDTIHLQFYFACEGLKHQTDEHTIRRAIGAIYRNYLRRDIQVSTELRNTIKQIFKGELPVNVNIFDKVQKTVEKKINDTTYPCFLCSEIYRRHIEEVQNAIAANNMSMPSATVSGRLSSSSPSSSSSSTTSLSSYDSMGACSISLQEHSKKNAILPTLHEDSELTIADEPTAKTLDNSVPTLTEDWLLATQKRRLEIRPPGAHGYNVSFLSSYNPVSRVDSERQSCSSGHQTDSDTKSLVNLKDGQTHSHRSYAASESKVNDIKRGSVFVHPNIEANTSVIGPVQKGRLRNASDANLLSPQEFYDILKPKLEEVKKQQEQGEQMIKILYEQGREEQYLNSSAAQSIPFNSASVQRAEQAHPKALKAALFKEFPELNYDNDQAILDRHMSRVFSPHFSPGTTSPSQVVGSRPLPPLPQRSHGRVSESSTAIDAQSMRHSKSIPEHAATTTRKLSNKWPLLNDDSGISLYSADMPYKLQEMKPSKEEQLEETRKLLEDATRRPRRQGNQQQISTTQTTTMQSHHTNSLPRIRENSDEFTYGVYTFCDETLRYRTKLPGKQPTLKQFKDHLPKKGNFRFFFKTVCDDPDCPIIQEEVVNDNDIVPLFEGKVMGTIKPE